MDGASRYVGGGSGFLCPGGLAHADTGLVVEHYRNLWNFVRVIYEKEDDGSSICNATSCPRMSAGS